MQINPLYIPDANSANAGGSVEQFQFKSLSVIFADLIKIFSAGNDKDVTFNKDSLTRKLSSDDLQVSENVSLINFDANNYDLYKNMYPLNQSNEIKIASNVNGNNYYLSSFDKLIDSIEFLSFELTQDGKVRYVKEDTRGLHNYITKSELPKLTEYIINFIKQNSNNEVDLFQSSIAGSSTESEKNIIDEIANDLNNALIKNISVIINIEGETETLEIMLSPVLIDMTYDEESYIFFPDNDSNGIKNSTEFFELKFATDKPEVLSQTQKSAEFTMSEASSFTEEENSILLNNPSKNDIGQKNLQAVFSLKISRKVDTEQKDIVSTRYPEVVDEKNKNNLITPVDTESLNQSDTILKTNSLNDSDKRFTIAQSNSVPENKPDRIIPIDRKIFNKNSYQSLPVDKFGISSNEKFYGQLTNKNPNNIVKDLLWFNSYDSENTVDEKSVIINKEQVIDASEIKSNKFISREANISFNTASETIDYTRKENNYPTISEKLNKHSVENVIIRAENDFINKPLYLTQKINESETIFSENVIDNQHKITEKLISQNQKELIKSSEEKSALTDIIRSFNKINSKLSNDTAFFRITVKPVLPVENNHTNDNTQHFTKHNTAQQVFNDESLKEKRGNVAISKDIVNSETDDKEITFEKNQAITKNETSNIPVSQMVKPNIANAQKNTFRQMNNLVETLKYLLTEREVNSGIKDIIVHKRTDNEIELKLMPDRLGKIKVKLNIHENHLNATLEVENRTVQSLVSNNIDYLKNSLTQQGLQLNSVSISLFSSETKSGKTFSQRKKTFDSDSGKAEIDSISHQLIKSLGYNTYEYIA